MRYVLHDISHWLAVLESQIGIITSSNRIVFVLFFVPASLYVANDAVRACFASTLCLSPDSAQVHRYPRSVRICDRGSCISPQQEGLV